MGMDGDFELFWIWVCSGFEPNRLIRFRLVNRFVDMLVQTRAKTIC